MGGNDRFQHSHESRGEWPVEQQVHDILNVPNHHHTVTDTRTGDTGAGSGRTQAEAEHSAWDNLRGK